MATDLSDVVEELKGLKQTADGILLALAEFRSIVKQNQRESVSLGPVATTETPSSSSAKASGASAKSKDSGISSFGTGVLTATSFARDLANPFTSRAEVGLSALESAGPGLGAAIGGYVGGGLGAKIGQTIGSGLGSAAFSENRFVLDSTKRDLNSYLSGLAGVGIVATKEQATEARDFFRGQNETIAKALKVGAESLDGNFLGGLISGGGSNNFSAKDSANLNSIAEAANRLSSSDFSVKGE